MSVSRLDNEFIYYPNNKAINRRCQYRTYVLFQF